MHCVAFGLAMAAHVFHLPAAVLLNRVLIFGLGGTLAHSTFCILNDICDRDFDMHVGKCIHSFLTSRID
jgi:4-hydroxybenzoate polyprenyltransferase